MKKEWSYKLVFMVNACNIFSTDCFSSFCSQLLEVLPSSRGVGDDTRVVSLERSGLNEGVLIRGHELSFVVGAAVTDHNLGWILVGHDNGGLGQSASERVGVVGSQRLLKHAGMEVLSNLVGLGREAGSFRRSLGWKVNRLGCTVIESQTHGLTVLGQNRVARSNFGIFKHSRGLLTLFFD